MAMEPSDLFMLRGGLIEAGMEEEAAEKVAVAMESAVAKSIESVLEKMDAKMDARFSKVAAKMEIFKRDMTIRLGLMIMAATGLILSGIKLFLQ